MGNTEKEENERMELAKIFNQRRDEVNLLMDAHKTIPVSKRKELAEKYKCTCTAIWADMVNYNRKSNDCIYPSKTAKLMVLERDAHTCQYCGSKGKKMIADHIIPAILGGNGKDYNLVCACMPCNSKKKLKVWTPNNITILMALNPTHARLIISLSVLSHPAK